MLHMFIDFIDLCKGAYGFESCIFGAVKNTLCTCSFIPSIRAWVRDTVACVSHSCKLWELAGMHGGVVGLIGPSNNSLTGSSIDVFVGSLIDS